MYGHMGIEMKCAGTDGDERNFCSVQIAPTHIPRC